MKKRIQILATSPEKILAFAASQPLDIPDKAETPLSTSIVWMPAGRHAICAGTLSGPAFTGEIVCDEQAARAVSASFADITKTGQRVWLDFDHEDADASAWIKGFSWDASKGIIANLEWTAKGEQAVRGKSYYSFSPAFEAEAKTGRVVGLIEGHAAGGLVNAPAFGAAMPALIAARMGAATTNKTAPDGHPELTNMNEVLVKLLAALGIQAPADPTEGNILALIAKHINTAKPSPEVEAIKAELAKAQETIAAQAKKSATEAEAFSIKVKEIEAVQAARPNVSVTTTDMVDVLAAYASKDPSQLPLCERNVTAREDLARERALIWARDIAPFVKKESLHTVVSLAEKRKADVCRVTAKNSSGNFAIQAANTLGTLSGSLITQQSLSLLKTQLPALSIFTTDFSNQAAKLTQQIITRLRTVPAVQLYVPATGYVSTPVTTTDVPVTISVQPYVQFDYNVNELGSTNRDLFGEQTDGACYGLGKYILDMGFGLFTLANYPLAAQKAIVALGAFNRAAIIAQRVALKKRKVWGQNRYGIVNSDYAGQMMQDPTIVSLATYQRPELIAEDALPRIAGFGMSEYTDLPTTANLVAVFGVPEAAIIATRLPTDYVDAQLGANYGAVSQITDPNTGLSVMLVQYVNHDAGASRYRVAVQAGVAVGDSTRAQLVVSA